MRTSTSPKFGLRAAKLRFGKIEELGSRVGAAVDAARKFLFSQQHEEGYWCGELEADTTLESDYILLHTLLGTGEPGALRRRPRDWILSHQNEDGGWSIYADGPSNISASVKAYFGLKLAGYTARSSGDGSGPQEDSRDGRRDRSQHLYQDLSVLLRAVRLRRGSGDSAGDRAVSELVLVQHLRNFFVVARHPGAALDLLRQEAIQEDSSTRWASRSYLSAACRSRSMHLHWAKKLVSWRNFFLVLDRMTHWLERVHVRPLRSLALKSAEKWMLERFEMSDGLGAIYPVDHERDHRAALPGLFARRSAGDSRHG